MTDSKFSFAHLTFDRVNLQQAAERVLQLAERTTPALVVTPNADHVVRAQFDVRFMRILQAADLVTADGMPIVWASMALGQSLPERVTGADLLPKVCELAAACGKKVFLFGGLPGEAEAAGKALLERFPGLQIVGAVCPPFGFEEDREMTSQFVQEINASQANILFVGVGSPKQEEWIIRNRKQLSCGVALGVGASIAFQAGQLRRAPQWMQNSGLEWLYRFLQEPRRLALRYAKDSYIIVLILKSLFLRYIRTSEQRA